MKSLAEKQKELQSLLTKDDGIKVTIDSLKKILLPESENYKSTILIESHINKIRREKLQGIISFEQSNLEENKTRKNLIDLIDSIKNSDTLLIVNQKRMNISTNKFLDSRDGQTYKTIEINGSEWMAQNLNFDCGTGSWYYKNDYNNGSKFGRLYTLKAAKKACPSEWRLPTSEEWEELISQFGGYIIVDENETRVIGDDYKQAFNLLTTSKEGTFSAKFGGFRGWFKTFFHIGEEGKYWSSSKTSFSFGAYSAFNFSNNHKGITKEELSSWVGLSCRCIKIKK